MFSSGKRTPLSPSQAILQKLGPPVGPPGSGGAPPNPPPQLPLNYASWSTSGSSLAYVFGNNVYYRSSPTSMDIPLSSSGKKMLEKLIYLKP